MDLTFQTIAFIRLDYNFTGETERTTLVCNELCNFLSHDLLTPPSGNCTYLKIKHVTDRTEFSKYKELLGERTAPLRSCLVIDYSFEVSESNFNIYQGNDETPITDEEQWRSLVYHLLRDFTTDVVRDIAFVANIASPGSLLVSKILTQYENVNVLNHSGIPHDLSYGVDLANEYEWPPITKLPFQQAWEWLSAIEKVDTSLPVVRALSFATRITSIAKNDLGGPFDLVWAMAGLESLYGRGNVGMKSQLLEKSEALLGRRFKFKKRFSWMYDFRSRILHGDVLVNSDHYSQFLPYNDESKAESEASDCYALASILLITTLQHMCRNNLSGLDFEYKVGGDRLVSISKS